MFDRWLLVFVIVISFVASAAGQTLPVTQKQFQFCPAHVDDLYCLLPNFGFRNLPFTFSLETGNMFRLNTLLGAETSTLPLPSPASGVTFIWDPQLHYPIFSRESLGPILSDRTETLGARRLAVAFTYQHFGFDSFDGRPLNQFNDILARSVNLRVEEFTTFLTWGLTRRVDVSVAFPVRTVRMSASGLGFTVVGNNVVTVPNSETEGSSGLSDITLRAKATAWKAEHGGVGFGVDVRTPTGEPLKFLGAGAIGVKPFVIASWGRRFRQVYLAPHLNVGYEWNGTSILGGLLLGQEGRLPRRLTYAAGIEMGLVKRTTMTFDLNGERLFNAERSYVFNQFINPTSVQITSKSVNLKDGSVGAKINPWGNLLLTGNLSWRLDRGGLRARMVPLGGVSYTF